MKQKTIQVIINPASGKDRPVLQVLNTVFGEAGINWDVAITKAAGDGLRLAQEAVHARVDAVAVYGGDGTVTEVAAGLANSNVPLAILPGGTANAIALALNIPTDLATAARLACDDQAVIRTVDLGKIDHRHFLVAIGIGIPGALAEGADREAKDRLGVLAYAVSSLQALRTAQIATYQLTLDGREVVSEGVMCVIANSGNFGIPGVSLASTIDMSDGLLDVIIIRSADLNSILSVAASVVRQDDSTAPFERWQARKVTVKADPPQAIQADGEVLEPGSISAELLPCAIRVIVPAEESKANKDSEAKS